MILSRLQLQHFRNYRRLDLGLQPGATMLCGANGAGKSNLVEAVFALATTKSFRARFDREMIDHRLDPFEAPFPFARLQGDASADSSGNIRVEMLISGSQKSGNRATGGTHKQFRLNGAAKRATDIVGQIKAVLFSPSDVEIVSGSPSARRRYIDLMLCQVDRSYLKLLQSYGRIVQQRNAALTHLRGKSRGSVLEVWDEKLVMDGADIVVRRMAMMARLAGLARETHRELSGVAERLEVTYAPSIGDLDPITTELETVSTRHVEEVFRRRLVAEARSARDPRVTGVGPHRDDLDLSVDGVSLLAYGSRGQHRTAALALRMAEARYIFDQTGQQPVLLLDEALAELDDDRREHLLRFVRGYPQVILTGTSAATIPHDFRDVAVILHIHQGEVAS